MSAFDALHRPLLRDADVEDQGRIRIRTSSGAHFTAEVVLEALEARGKKEK